jgi:hypothetical protein
MSRQWPREVRKLQRLSRAKAKSLENVLKNSASSPKETAEESSKRKRQKDNGRTASLFTHPGGPAAHPDRSAP